MTRLFLLVCAFLASLPVMAETELAVEDLVARRLMLMKAVAAYKWEHDLPIEDSVREGDVLAVAAINGLSVGFTTGSTKAFFRSQIEAAKEIQNYWISQWREKKSRPVAVLDLSTSIRPELLRIGEDLIRKAAEKSPVDRNDFMKSVTVEGLSDGGKEKIFRSLTQLEFYPDRLTQVLDSGLLRVGTTGDYAPFSYSEEGEQAFQGIDIDMAKDLATALGVKPLFVQTTWSSLMKDLEGSRFDIAMSGVSRTLDRQRVGFFSIPYHVGGKTALSRCDDVQRFDSLIAINQPSVRVAVNPGGTNERFVDTRLRRARKIIFQDNRAIFSHLVKGEADIMITDRIEADWQVAKNPLLCKPVKETFSYQQKAYLMPRDIALKEFVDTWLSMRIAEGKLSPLLTVR